MRDSSRRAANLPVGAASGHGGVDVGRGTNACFDVVGEVRARLFWCMGGGEGDLEVTRPLGGFAGRPWRARINLRQFWHSGARDKTR